MDVISRITSSYGKLSKGHKKIADYVSAHYDKAAFMNVGQLASATGKSEATVVRFSTELGYEKYQLFQKAVLDYAKSKLTSVQRMDLTYDRMGGADILSSVLHADIDKIRETLANIDPAEFDGVVEKIASAKRIYVIGLRSAQAMADLLGFYLNIIFDNVKVVSSVSASEIFEQMFRVGRGDVVIGISFPRYSIRTINALKYARKMGGTVIGITDGAMSPIKENADYSLLARSGMESFLDSLVAPFSLLNALIVALGAKKREEVYRNLETLENIWHEYEVYDDAEDEQ